MVNGFEDKVTVVTGVQHVAVTCTRLSLGLKACKAVGL